MEIYRSFRGCRDFSFRDQIQRAAVSVPANIAEGLERNSPAKCKQFMSFAKGSAGEVRAFLLIAEEVQLIDKDQAQRLREQAIRVSKRLYRFIFSLESRFDLRRGGYRASFPPST